MQFQIDLCTMKANPNTKLVSVKMEQILYPLPVSPALARGEQHLLPSPLLPPCPKVEDEQSSLQHTTVFSVG